jgi:radical SAM protein with 4Fe4S-binding SPASM domain
MKKREKASDDLIEKVIRETIPTAYEACPFLMQEPLLEPRLREILLKIKQTNPRCTTTIYTTLNGPIGPLFEIIDDHTLDNIYLSIYSQEWQKFDLDESDQKLIKLIRYRDTQLLKKPRFIWQAINDIKPYRTGIAEEMCDYRRLVPIDTFHGKMPTTVRSRGPAKERKPCRRIIDTLNVLSNGDIVPCCIDFEGEMAMGNMYEKSAAQIWNGKKFRNFRKMHEEGKWSQIDLCRDCITWEWM